jgi:hypothetical protein
MFTPLEQDNHLTAVFTGPPSDIGFQENPGSAAPVQFLLGVFAKKPSALFLAPTLNRHP